MRIFTNLNIDWMGKRKIFYLISLTIFMIGVISIIFRGLEFGIDFNGGSEIVLEFQKPVQIAEIRDHVENIGLGNVELKTFGSETGVLIRTELQNLPPDIYHRVLGNIDSVIENIYSGIQKTIVDTSASNVTYEFLNADTTNILVEKLSSAGFQTSKVSESLDNKQLTVRVGISDWIKTNLRNELKDNPFTILREYQVLPKVGNELKTDAIVAIILSLIAILIYLAFRFKFIFAFAAVAALFHDVLITIGLYAALYGVIPGLNLEIDLTIVAAFLTLIGYSINDTVIVFDRIRENLKIHKNRPIRDEINFSINKTMSRTVLTGGTVLLALLVILIYGGEVLRAFSFTLFFGIIIGTYSSVFVASALVLEYVNRSNKKVQF